MRPSKYKFHLLKKGEYLPLEGADIQRVRTQANDFGKRYGVVIVSIENERGVLIQRVR